ncbi:glycosyltransferase family 4 protein [Prochlorococcus marinus]|uniref:glycosyltransferase family 4 protein n=1 Tax=Prochlorococcus marinus TaxID=1219 RepID=UPI001ADA6462|nr:glycosyltransferase family 4 protein [Prochlorococcus marinus]MBO8221408.1 glycosyltransferase family 4 protein [Prochlorococcus marinus CUG1417]MBW3074218.1 hypothetical protein [Prochlorococcus marinus str. MU1417]
MKKIIIVSNTGWYLYNFRFKLIKELLKKYNVTLVFPFDGYSKPLKETGCEIVNWKLNRNSINPLLEIFSIIDLINIFLKIKPDMAHHFTIKACLYGTIAGRIVGLKKIFNAITGLGHVFLAKNTNAFIYRVFMVFIYRKVFNHKSSNLIFQNSEDRNFFQSLKIISKNKSFLIRGSGVDVNYYKREKEIKKIDLKKTIKIFFPSRIIKEKGIIELLEACESLIDDNVNLCLYVPSDLSFHNRSFLSKREIDKLKNKSWIKLLGQLSDLKPIYENSDIVILPSWREGLSMALLEASAMECSIITTNVPGCNDVVKHGESGLIVPPHDPVSIKLAILFLINNPVISEKFGKNARLSTIKKFNSEMVISQTMSLYEKF